MSDEMIDRVMKAIDAASTYGEGPRWKQELPGLARAAIEAMREPTPAMSDAAAATPGQMSYADVWRSMIDAALGDSVTVGLPEWPE